MVFSGENDIWQCSQMYDVFSVFIFLNQKPEYKKMFFDCGYSDNDFQCEIWR